MSTNGVTDAWGARLRAVRGLDLTLTRRTQALCLDDHSCPTGGRLELDTGTRVRYVETRYDAMRLDHAFHMAEVMSGPATGAWVDLLDVVGRGPLPWE